MKTLESDVLIVAAGLSGLAAAVAAAESGMHVIAIEKAAVTGGTANMGMGLLAINSKYQRALGYHHSAQEMFDKHMHYSHWLADCPRLVMEFYKRCGDTIDWLDDMGVKFRFNAMKLWAPIRLKGLADNECVAHHVVPDDGSPIGPRCASTMTRHLTERAKELGVEFYLETPAKDLIVEDGRVVGAMAVDRDGEEVKCLAKAVIVATGGFGDNTEMIKEFTGLTWGEDLFSFRIPGNVGDGIHMVWRAGGAKMKPILHRMYQIPDNMNHFTLEGAFRQPLLWVNKMGERFMPEDCIGNTTHTGNAIFMQPGHTCFTILDADTLKYYKKRGVDIQGVQGLDVFKNFEQAAEAAKAEGYRYYFEADSVEELCEKTGIDLEGLRSTLDEYNACCDDHYDSVFGKEKEFLRPVRTPKFYAIQSFMGGYGTLGGIKINHKTEVLDSDGRKIPGLYAAGTDAYNIAGDSYNFFLTANTMSFCVNTGRMAGENAAEYVYSLQ